MIIWFSNPRRYFIGVILLLIVWLLQISASQAQEPGETAFKESCGICHTLGSGRLVGPDLLGVHEKRSEEWLEKFVRSSQSMIKAGDPEAMAIFEEFSKMPMPDALLTEQQIKDVLSYVKAGNSPQKVKAQQTIQAQQIPLVAIEENIKLGQNLFQGTTRFKNGGPTCNACHEVNNDAVIGGGILAVELTSVFSKMGGNGVRAILGSPPFPVMQAAYKDKPLTDEENSALVAFLQQADKDHLMQQPRDYGAGLFVSGVAGTSLLFGLCSFFWRGRKKKSVNQEIFDRQIKSDLDRT